MKRYQIRNKIEKKQNQIAKLRLEIIELNKQDYLLSDKNRKFIEKEEDFMISSRPKIFEKKLIGRIHFKQRFTDRDTGEVVVIHRHPIVRINGQWQ